MSPSQSAITQWGWGFHTLRGGIDPGSMIPSQSAITLWGWGFHTLRGRIRLEDLHFRPRVVGVEEVWNDF